MRDRALKKVNPGDEIKAEDWNYLLDLITRNSIDVGSTPGLIMRRGVGGTGISLAASIPGRSVGKTSGTITARSGLTPGTGSVDLYYFDSGSLVFTNVTKTVYSFSSTTGGIPTDTYVWIEQDTSSNWWIIAVDCGN